MIHSVCYNSAAHHFPTYFGNIFTPNHIFLQVIELPTPTFGWTSIAHVEKTGAVINWQVRNAPVGLVRIFQFGMAFLSKNEP